jgi:hypothetical protein
MKTNFIRQLEAEKNAQRSCREDVAGLATSPLQMLKTSEREQLSIFASTSIETAANTLTSPTAGRPVKDIGGWFLPSASSGFSFIPTEAKWLV